MNETTKTTQYLVAAVVSVLLATFATWSSAPSKLSGYDSIGKVFFEDFNDPSAASALRVVTYNESTASARPFTVEKKEGVWRIPSHHNYPADGKDRLAKIASSLIGVKRGAVASLVAADHERFGVVDPLDETQFAVVTEPGLAREVCAAQVGNAGAIRCRKQQDLGRARAQKKKAQSKHAEQSVHRCRHRLNQPVIEHRADSLHMDQHARHAGGVGLESRQRHRQRADRRQASQRQVRPIPAP